MRTKKHIVAYKRFDVVVVPFPFTDRNSEKRRPALVISDAGTFNDRSGHSVMAMITSATHSAWPLDVLIGDLGAAGLPSPSIVRMKLFTLDHRMVHRKIGSLSVEDQDRVNVMLDKLSGKSVAN